MHGRNTKLVREWKKQNLKGNTKLEWKAHKTGQGMERNGKAKLEGKHETGMEGKHKTGQGMERNGKKFAKNNFVKNR